MKHVTSLTTEVLLHFLLNETIHYGYLAMTVKPHFFHMVHLTTIVQID